MHFQRLFYLKRSYSQNRSWNPDKECFEIGQWDEDGDHSTPLQSFIQEAAQWPDFDGPDFTPLGGMSSIQFREIVRRQFEVYFAAARQLLELICIGLDIDQSKFDNLLENHASTFRLIHNPPRHDIIPKGMQSNVGINLKPPL